MHTVVLGLGANLGDPHASFSAAIGNLTRSFERMRVSGLYRSAPVGHTAQPDFLNLVCAGGTCLSAGALLAETQAIERSLGRVRSFPNAPRTIDIDILAYDSLILDTPDLVLPHPRMHQRAFVLVPLAEIAPEWRHPVLGTTAAEMLANGGPWERVEYAGRLPGT